jgi:hypothetical protein
VKTLLVLGLVIVALWAWTSHERSVTEHRLAGVASMLAGRRVGVDCQGFWAEMLDIGNRSGEVDFPAGRPPDHMFLTRSTCKRLRSFADEHERLDCLASIDWARWSVEEDFNGPCERGARADAEAVNTLAHESMHLRGVQNEAGAQCLAIQADAWTAQRLGAGAEEAADLAAFVYAMQPALPTEYQSADCRRGGSLDTEPQTFAFPTEVPATVPSS